MAAEAGPAARSLRATAARMHEDCDPKNAFVHDDYRYGARAASTPRRASPKMLPTARSIRANPAAAERELPPARRLRDARSRGARRAGKCARERQACACPARSSRGAPYSVSPTTGCPMAAKCARIWCVRPVCGSAATSVKFSSRAITRQSVRACAAFRDARRHARAPARIARNRQRDGAGIARHVPVHQRQINFVHVARAELFGKMFVMRRSLRATTIAPEVPRSSRCTMPGRSAPPASESVPRRCSSAFTSVPRACPRPRAPPFPRACSRPRNRRPRTADRAANLPAAAQAAAAAALRPRSIRRRRCDGQPREICPSTRTWPSPISS